MGLFGRKRKAGVRGTARVISVKHAPDATHGSLRMTVVVEAPGVPAFSHEYKKFGARVDTWPDPGDVLPVEVDPDDHGEVEVLWDEIPTTRDAAAQEAEQLAAFLRQQQDGGVGHPPSGSPGAMPAGPDASGLADMVSQLQQMFPGAVVNVGTEPVDPGGAGVPPSPSPPSPPAPPDRVDVVASQSAADPVERLEKLARLRDAGVVDQAQFDQLRAQILEQAGLDGP
jgi:hypothetical protein